jgi:hypothetical protein
MVLSVVRIVNIFLESKTLSLIEDRVLRRILGHKKQEVAEAWDKIE